MLRIRSKSSSCLFRAMSTNTQRPSKKLDKFIRVDHAGELGADRIYAGQMAVLGKSKMGSTIQQVNIIWSTICFQCFNLNQFSDVGTRKNTQNWNGEFNQKT